MTKKISLISGLHYLKLVSRSLLFLAVLVNYILLHLGGKHFSFRGFERPSAILIVVGAVFTLEMLLRFFPSRLESMGCQKQFKRNYIPPCEPMERPSTWKTTLLVAVLWLALNALIGAGYLLGLYDEGVLILTALFYSVCDMICILFYCPFQTLIMKNKCCGSCRIYNWDYAMMFTPLVFIPTLYTYSLLGISLLLLLVWELSVRLHPERFAEQTNEGLACKNCKEKLCHHKKQLRSFLRKNKRLLLLKGNAILEKVKTITKSDKGEKRDRSDKDKEDNE